MSLGYFILQFGVNVISGSHFTGAQIYKRRDRECNNEMNGVQNKEHSRIIKKK